MTETTPSDPLDVSVCIPVFNEKSALRETLLELQVMMASLPYSYEFILIDDGSSDGCLETIRDIPDVRIIRHQRNLGGGIARLTGIRRARGRWILQTDADGTYPVERVPEMLKQMEQADMVIGARVRESATDWRWLRIMMKGLLKWLASIMAGYRIPDLNSGLRVYDRELALHYAYLYPPGHSIMSTMTLAFLTDRHRVEFVAIDYNVRKGPSSFHPIRDTYNYFITILRTVVFFDPLRVLMPVVLGFGLVALLFSIRNLILFASLGSVPPLLWLVAFLFFVLAILSDQFSRISRQIRHGRILNLYDRVIVEETEPWQKES
ncbi:MAG: glycosyltransferase family 2 protein [Magnetococcales bacterium]|nr:glycosyltransferase family 2 protein [Magnetococcales bacterium]